MTDLAIGSTGVAVLLVLLLAGLPIGVSLGIVGFAGLAIVLGPEPAFIKSGVIVLETLTRYELGTLPLFLLMAHLCSSANASRDFFDAAETVPYERCGGIEKVPAGVRRGTHMRHQQEQRQGAQLIARQRLEGNDATLDEGRLGDEHTRKSRDPYESQRYADG